MLCVSSLCSVCAWCLLLCVLPVGVLWVCSLCAPGVLSICARCVFLCSLCVLCVLCVRVLSLCPLCMVCVLCVCVCSVCYVPLDIIIEPVRVANERACCFRRFCCFIVSMCMRVCACFVHFCWERCISLRWVSLLEVLKPMCQSRYDSFLLVFHVAHVFVSVFLTLSSYGCSCRNEKNIKKTCCRNASKRCGSAFSVCKQREMIHHLDYTNYCT